MGIVKSCIILIAFILICVLGFFCIRLANVLNHLQKPVYDPDYDYPLIMDAKGELERLLATTYVIVMVCVFCIFCVIYVHISQCMKNSGERRVKYKKRLSFSSAMAFLLVYLLGAICEKLNNLLTVSFYEIFENVDLWNTNVTNLLCKLVACTSCLIMVCIGCIFISQRSRIRRNNGQIHRRLTEA